MAGRAVRELWGIPGEGRPLRDLTPSGRRFPNRGVGPMRNRPREGESALHGGGDFPSGGHSPQNPSLPVSSATGEGVP